MAAQSSDSPKPGLKYPSIAPLLTFTGYTCMHAQVTGVEELLSENFTLFHLIEPTLGEGERERGCVYVLVSDFLSG